MCNSQLDTDHKYRLRIPFNTLEHFSAVTVVAQRALSFTKPAQQFATHICANSSNNSFVLYIYRSRLEIFVTLVNVLIKPSVEAIVTT